MINIYINDTFLNKLCVDEYIKDDSEQSTWYRIIRRQKMIYLDKSSDNKGKDDSNYRDTSLRGEGVFYTDETNFLKEFKSGRLTQEEVHKRPSPVFLLDIDDNLAKNIQEKYGVICQSIHNLDDSVLTLPTETYVISKKNAYKQRCDGYRKNLKEERKNNKSWEYMLKSIKLLPWNNFIFVDRYIFSEESESSQFATKNIIKILDNLLPVDLNRKFTISFFFDPKQTGWKLKELEGFAEIANRLNTGIAKLKVKHKLENIRIELIGIVNSQDGSNYERIHNRKILGDYAIIEFDHSIKALDDKNNGFYKQKIVINTLYSQGLSGRGDTPNDMQKADLADYAEIFKFCSKYNHSTYRFSCDGNHNCTYKDIQNSLLLNIN